MGTELTLIAVGPPTTAELRTDYVPVCQLPRRQYFALGRQAGELKIRSLYINFEALERATNEAGGGGGRSEGGGDRDPGDNIRGVAVEGRPVRED